MPGAVTFGGVGSGIDVEGLISGLVNASKGPLNAAQSRLNEAKAAITTISDISSLLATLKASSQALDTAQEVGSYAATTTSTAYSATAAGNSLPARYAIQVTQLAQEQRTYTQPYGSSADALSISGDIEITVGSEATVAITVAATDSLEDIASKINDSNAKLTASVFFDGTNHRLQLRGAETGASGAVTFAGAASTSLGLDMPANTFQIAQDASLILDGFTVTSASNQITGAIQGVTIDLQGVSTSAEMLTIATDATAIESKVEDFVAAYNNIVQKVHQVAGFGSTVGSVRELKNDGTMRSLTTRLSGTVAKAFAAAGTYQTLSSIGVEQQRDGTLKLDSAKLATAIAADPDSVEKLMGGDHTNDGFMDALIDLADDFTDIDSGALTAKDQALDSRVRVLEDQITREQERLANYTEQLRKALSNMDSQVAFYNNQLSYLLNITG